MGNRTRPNRPTVRAGRSSLLRLNGRVIGEGKTLAAKHLVAICLTAAAITGLSVACNATARYRVLRFFFDGVPEPGQKDAAPEDESEPGQASAAESVGDQASAQPAVAPKPYHLHPPFKEFQCRRCHQPAGVALVATPQEGLCSRCHQGIPGDVQYVHGPVAVRDCLFCHHPHESPERGMLLYPPNETCLRCHDRADLTVGPQHAEFEQSLCIDCHDPHGGSVRFFLKRKDR